MGNLTSNSLTCFLIASNPKWIRPRKCSLRRFSPSSTKRNNLSKLSIGSYFLTIMHHMPHKALTSENTCFSPLPLWNSFPPGTSMHHEWASLIVISPTPFSSSHLIDLFRPLSSSIPQHLLYSPILLPKTSLLN